MREVEYVVVAQLQVPSVDRATDLEAEARTNLENLGSPVQRARTPPELDA